MAVLDLLEHDGPVLGRPQCDPRTVRPEPARPRSDDEMEDVRVDDRAEADGDDASARRTSR